MKRNFVICCSCLTALLLLFQDSFVFSAGAAEPGKKKMPETIVLLAEEGKFDDAIEKYRLLKEQDVSNELQFKTLSALMKCALQKKNPTAAEKISLEVFNSADLTASQRVSILQGYAESLIRTPETREKGFAVSEEILSIPGISGADAMKSISSVGNAYLQENFPKSGFGSYNDDGIDKALAYYRKMLNHEALSPSDKVELYRLAANCQLEKMQVSEANETLAAAARIPGLSKTDMNQVQLNRIHAFLRELDYDAAEELIEEIAPNVSESQKAALDQMKVQMLLGTRGAEEAAAFFREICADDYKYARFLVSCELMDEADKYFLKVLENPEEDPRNRVESFKYLAQNLALNDVDAEEFKKFCLKYDVDLVLLDENFSRWYVDFFSGWNRRQLAKSPDICAWAFERGLQYDPAQMKAYPFYLEDLLKLERYGDAEKVIENLLALEAAGTPGITLSPEEVRQYQLDLMALRADREDPEKDASEIASAIDAQVSEVKAKDHFLQESAKFAMKVKNFDLAKSLWSRHEALLVPAERRSIQVKFIPNGPEDITSYMASDYFKDAKNHAVLDRKYGNNLQTLLATDAAITTRQITQDDGSGERTFFTAFCDEEGVKILFYMPSSPEKLRDIRNGFIQMGGYELYIGLGPGVPYNCLILACSPGVQDGSDLFVTQYNNKHYRRIRRDAGNVSFECQMVEGGMAGLLKIDWSVCVDRLPGEGDRWPFEPIHWE